MKLSKIIIFFLVINFSALGIGSWLMNNGPQTSWYTSLNQAPWTPPGWVFGVAWATTMVCFSIYMAYLYLKMPTSKVIILFIIQFALNVSWNYIFFNQHLVGLGLLSIIVLTIVITLLIYLFKNEMKVKTLLILPYFVWLCIATSLNAYIFINN